MDEKKTTEIQNWHINEMQSGWRAERENHKAHTQRVISEINAAKDDRIARVKAEADAKIREAKAAAEAAILAEKRKLQECLLAVARREDEYMNKFRNYVASLPKDEQAAYERK